MTTTARHRKDTATMYDGTPPTTEAKASPFGNDFPDVHSTEAVIRNGGPILEALGYTSDRLARIGHTLEDLDDAIRALTERLEPVLTDGSPATYPTADDEASADPEDTVDRRSTIARNITNLGLSADVHADHVGDLIRRLAAVRDAVEL